MKKIVTLTLAAMLLVFSAGCGTHKETAEEHAAKLARGEIKPNANVSENAGEPMEIPTVEPGIKQDAVIKDDGTAEFSIGTAKTSEYIDTAENDYKSFSFLQLESADFFKNKRLTLVATIEDHSMSFLEDIGYTLTVTDEYLEITGKDADGNDSTAANYVYLTTDVLSSPGGLDYVILAFGDHVLAADDADYNVDCFALIDMPKDSVSEDGSKVIEAGQYVLLIETIFPQRYELFRIEG